MVDLRACPSCRRHVVIGTKACPFCATTLPVASAPEVPIGTFSRAAVFAGLALTGPACWTGNQPAAQTTTTTTSTTTTPPDPGDPSTPTGNKPDVTTARIEGTVTNARTGQALVRYPIDVTPRGGQPRTALTDANGHYRIDKLPAGDYQLAFGGKPMPRRSPVIVNVSLHVGELKRLDQAIYIPEPSNIPMPYGAPPVRDRMV